MFRPLVLMCCLAATVSAQVPTVVGRVEDGDVISVAEFRSYQALYAEAYRYVPPDEQLYRDNPLLRPMVRRMDGLWFVVQMRFDGRLLTPAEIKDFAIVFEDGAFRHAVGPAYRSPIQPVDRWALETKSRYAAPLEADLQEANVRVRDYEAIRPLMMYRSETRATICWFDRFGESIDPALRLRDPYTLTSIPEFQRAMPAFGTIDVTPGRIVFRVRGQGLRWFLPANMQGRLGDEREVEVVLERQPRLPQRIAPADAIPPQRSRERFPPAGDPNFIVRTPIASPTHLVFDAQPVPSSGPTRIVFMPEEKPATAVVRGR